VALRGSGYGTTRVALNGTIKCSADRSATETTEGDKGTTGSSR
jgi:hypothetical protein